MSSVHMSNVGQRNSAIAERSTTTMPKRSAPWLKAVVGATVLAGIIYVAAGSNSSTDTPVSSAQKVANTALVYVPPTEEEIRFTADCLAALGHPISEDDTFVRSKIFGHDSGPRITTPDGYVEFIIPTKYWGSMFSMEFVNRVFMFTIPYKGRNYNGAVEITNSSYKPVPIPQKRLGTYGPRERTLEYFDSVLDPAKPRLTDYITRPDGTPFVHSDNLEEFVYTQRPPIPNMVYFLKGSLYDGEIFVWCSTDTPAKLCQSWIGLEKSRPNDTIQINFKREYMDNSLNVEDFLDYTQKTIQCMRPYL